MRPAAYPFVYIRRPFFPRNIERDRGAARHQTIITIRETRKILDQATPHSITCDTPLSPRRRRIGSDAIASRTSYKIYIYTIYLSKRVYGAHLNIYLFFCLLDLIPFRCAPTAERMVFPLLSIQKSLCFSVHFRFRY